MRKGSDFGDGMGMTRRTCCTRTVDDKRNFVLRFLKGLIVRIQAGFTLKHFIQGRNLQYLEVRTVVPDLQDLQLSFWAVHEL